MPRVIHFAKFLATHNLLILKLGKLNIPNCYEITSRSGQPIFKVVQTIESSTYPYPSNDTAGSSAKPPFKLSIFDMRSGNEVVKVVAKQGADSV
jgi:hypothetical protein